MIPTIDYIRLRFDSFNTLCFDGQLKPLPLKLSKARTFLGKISFKRQLMLNGRYRYYDFTFHISTLMDRPEEVVEDTILHEMIHYWILSNGMTDSSAHGTIFRAKMKEINHKHGRHISITHRATCEEHDLDTQRRSHLVCISKMRDGRMGVTPATRSRLFQLWDAMAKCPDVVDQHWVLSTDPFFNRFPRAIRPKIYLVTKADLDAHLVGAKQLVRQGSTIRVISSRGSGS